MAITKLNPRTIWLGGSITIVNDITASEAITPGHLLERAAGQYKKHSNAGGVGNAYALDQSEMNKGIGDAYASGDLVMAGIGAPGTTFLAWLASGQNVADGAELMTNGAGLLTAQDADAKTIARALEAKDARWPVGDTRIRIEVV